MQEFYKLKTDIVLKNFHVKPKEGLSTREAKERLERYGPNKLETGKQISPIGFTYHGSLGPLEPPHARI